MTFLAHGKGREYGEVLASVPTLLLATFCTKLENCQKQLVVEFQLTSICKKKWLVIEVHLTFILYIQGSHSKSKLNKTYSSTLELISFY